MEESILKLIIGITTSIIYNGLASLGLTLQRKSYLFDQKNKQLWWIGFIIYFITSTLGSILVYKLLPITIITPLASFTLVFNALFAILLLKHKLTKKIFFGTIIILIGAIIISIYGNVNDPDHKLKELIDLFKTLKFILYFSIQEILLILILFFTISLSNEWILIGKFENLVGILYGFIGSCYGSQCILLSKWIIGLIFISFKDNQFNQVLPYIIIILLLLKSILQLYFLNLGIKYSDIIILIPINYFIFNISSLSNSIIVYNLSIYDKSLLFVFGGTLILLSGVLIISKQSKKTTIPFHSVHDTVFF